MIDTTYVNHPNSSPRCSCMQPATGRGNLDTPAQQKTARAIHLLLAILSQINEPLSVLHLPIGPLRRQSPIYTLHSSLVHRSNSGTNQP